MARRFGEAFLIDDARLPARFEARGVEPLPIEAIDKLKTALGRAVT